jgi:hypothetical protein
MTPRKKHVTIQYVPMWAPDPVCISWRTENSPTHAGIRTSDRPVRSQVTILTTLFRLTCLLPLSMKYVLFADHTFVPNRKANKLPENLQI